MKRLHPCWLSVAAVLLSTALGCGESGPPPVDTNVEAKAKVEAFRKLTDAMAKEPNGMEARASLEDFRNRPLDYEKNRTEAEQIVQLYNEKMKGKFQGEVAQEAQMEVAAIAGALKSAQ